VASGTNKTLGDQNRTSIGRLSYVLWGIVCISLTSMGRRRWSRKINLGFHPSSRRCRWSAPPPAVLGPCRCGGPRPPVGWRFQYFRYLHYLLQDGKVASMSWSQNKVLLPCLCSDGVPSAGGGRVELSCWRISWDPVGVRDWYGCKSHSSDLWFSSLAMVANFVCMPFGDVYYNKLY
jgi:hypothetical protein